MAYINAEETRSIRNALKAKYPAKDGWKFSVRNSNHTSVHVSIMKAPLKFTPKERGPGVRDLLAENVEVVGRWGINHHHLYTYNHSEVLEDILNVINTADKQNFDKSDIQSDYFHVGFYVTMEVGTWEKPYEFTGEEEKPRDLVEDMTNFLSKADKDQLRIIVRGLLSEETSLVRRDIANYVKESMEIDK